MADWQVTIKNHHPGYISWDQFLHNNAILQQNQTNGVETMLPAAAREGLALLQGMLICGICGHRMTVRYQGNGGLLLSARFRFPKTPRSLSKLCPVA